LRVCVDAVLQVRRGQPGGWLLSFVRPKESNQRKCRPGTPALRAALRCSSDWAAATQGDFLRGAQLAHGLENLMRPQACIVFFSATVIRARPVLAETSQPDSAARRRARGTSTPNPLVARCFRALHCHWFESPSEPPSSTAWPGAVGEHCVSGASDRHIKCVTRLLNSKSTSHHASCAPRRKSPWVAAARSREQRREPPQGAARRVAFCLVTFSWRSKRK
jgi:hypothetical protein